MTSLSAAVRAWRSAAGARSGPRTDTAQLLLAHLHRLHAAVRHDLPDGWTRRVALFTAYEDVLLQVCGLAGVSPTALDDLGHRPVYAAMSAERDLARIRTEADLEATGVTLDPRTDV